LSLAARKRAQLPLQLFPRCCLSLEENLDFVWCFTE